MADTKARVLVVGMGGVGRMGAYALEIGGKAQVTAVLRSNYGVVKERGFNIDSCEHGRDITGWRPTEIRQTVPDVVKENLSPYDFLLTTTKNVPDVPPSMSDSVAPAVTPGKTVIVLSQNGLNIEKPFTERFPTNPILCSTSMIGAGETNYGNIFHNDFYVQKIGFFNSPGVSQKVAEAAAHHYISIYNPQGKLGITYDGDTPFTRWRKLVYNASYNSVAAILRIDVTRIRQSQHIIDNLIRPIMLEIKAAAKSAGVELPADIAETLIRVDPVHNLTIPSMMQDIEKGNFVEFECIIGEPLREGTSRGVPMPTVATIYGILKALQLKTKEAKGLWESKFTEDNPYK